MPRTVVIVDDHEQFRRAARMLLELDGFDVIGDAATGADAVFAAERLRPDVLLVDVGLPDTSGFEIASALASSVYVVLVSSRDPTDCAARAHRSGALGFIAKDELSGERLSALLAEDRP